MEVYKDGKPLPAPVRKFHLAGDTDTEYLMTEDEFNQIVDL